jgi:hypothetical protein
LERRDRATSLHEKERAERERERERERRERDRAAGERERGSGNTELFASSPFSLPASTSEPEQGKKKPEEKKNPSNFFPKRVLEGETFNSKSSPSSSWWSSNLQEREKGRTQGERIDTEERRRRRTCFALFFCAFFFLTCSTLPRTPPPLAPAATTASPATDAWPAGRRASGRPPW